MSDDTQDPTSVEEATGTPEAPTMDAPTQDLDQTVDGEGDE